MNCFILLSATAMAVTPFAVAADAGRNADPERRINGSHDSSLKLREAALRKTIAKDIAWPGGIWGDNFWCLAALYLNEKTDEANARILKRAKEFIASAPENVPALSPADPKGGAAILKYAGISRQIRACGLLFDDPSAKTISQVFPVVEHPGGGRSQHSFWSAQHENALVIQRIAKSGRSTLGSYNTGKISMCFEGADLTKSEGDGRIFATIGKAFVVVKFLDGGHTWDVAETMANPAHFTDPGDTGRILIHAGDLTSHPSFEAFCKSVRSHTLTVTADNVDCRYGRNNDRIEMTRYDVASPANFTLPLINGSAIDLHPEAVYESPFLKVGIWRQPIHREHRSFKRVMDFGKTDN